MELKHQQKEEAEELQPEIYPVTYGIESEQTAIVYERVFNHFLDFIEIHDLKVLRDLDSKVVKKKIISYILFLRDEKGLSRTSIRVHLSAILRFFHNNNDEFILTIRNFKLHLPRDNFAKDKDRHYSTEEIAQVLEKCDERTKVIVLLLASTGIRVGALNTMKIGDLTKIPEYNLYKVKVYSGTNDQYITFCTSECATALLEYFEYRRRHGEELNDRSLLIREQFDVKDRVRARSPKPKLTQRAIEYAITNVLERSGVRSKEVHMTHGFRKFFINQCENNSSMKSLFVDVLVHHNIGVKKHYLRPKDSELLQEYLKAVDALTIDPTHRLQKENQDLKVTQAQEIASLRTQLNAREEKYSRDWEQLKEQLNEIKRMNEMPWHEYLKTEEGKKSNEWLESDEGKEYCRKKNKQLKLTT